MSQKQPIKSNLHPRNKHRHKYDLGELTKATPGLKKHIITNEYGDESINFFDPESVKALNKSLLFKFYNVKYWDFPEGFLCPPIPGRADYIHHAADLLDGSLAPKGSSIKVLDIGTGANCIYPIIGNAEYGWSFVATDVDEIAMKSAEKIIKENVNLSARVELRRQENRNLFFQNIIKEEETFELSVCNPPFHASAKAAKAANKRKFRNINPKSSRKKNLNFGGQANELWTKGGEERFIRDMIHESRLFRTSCYWFTSLVSKKEILQVVYQAFKKAEVTEYKTINMGQGNKQSRLVAWTFLTDKQRKIWADAKF